MLHLSILVELIGIKKGVARLMTKQLHALLLRSPFHLEHHFLFEGLQPRMGQIKGDADRGLSFQHEPLIGQVAIGVKRKILGGEVFMERGDAFLEIAVGDR